VFSSFFDVLDSYLPYSTTEETPAPYAYLPVALRDFMLATKKS